VPEETRSSAEGSWDKRDSRQYGVVDKQTGEVLDGFPILVPRRKRLGEGFFMGIQAAFVNLATRKLTHDGLRVLLYFLGRMEYENHIRISQSDVVRELSLDKSRVSRAIKRLLDEHILLPTEERIGRSRFYQLNPEYAWKGKVRNRPKRKESRRPSPEAGQHGERAEQE
jgi:DNA-binding transcriptional ArsR family regulator